MKIKIIDFFSIKRFHEIFNISLILMSTFKGYKVEYICGKSAKENIQKSIKKYDPNNKYNSKELIIKEKLLCEIDSKKGAFIRTLLGFFTTIHEFILQKKKDVIIFNYTNPLSLPIILALNILLKKKVVFCMHGELELQIQKIKGIKASKLYKFFYYISLRYILRYSKYSYILILGDSIKRNLVNIFPRINNRIISINHPYFINNEIKVSNNQKHNQIIRLGTIGVMKPEKGIKNLLLYASKLENDINNKTIEICSIGKVENFDYKSIPFINWIGATDGLPRDLFEKNIEQLDYILFLYPSYSYKLTASGAIFDAIKYGKPIISLRNDYFEDLFRNCPYIYFVDNMEILLSLTSDIINRKITFNSSYNYDTFKEKVSIESNSNLLFNQLIKND